MHNQIVTIDEQEDLSPLREQINGVALYPVLAQQNITFIRESLKDLWNMALAAGNDEIAGKIAEACSRAEMMTDHIGHQAVVINTVVAGLFKVREQRNQAYEKLEEMDEGIQAIRECKMPKNEELQSPFDDFQESHNQMFWESLPYDMARVLGEDWQHYDADVLYQLITVDEEEVDDEGEMYGFTFTQLKEFRAYLREIVEQIKTGVVEYE